jgi:hypothetical protein
MNNNQAILAPEFGALGICRSDAAPQLSRNVSGFVGRVIITDNEFP